MKKYFVIKKVADQVKFQISEHSPRPETRIYNQ
jgi:hypothetical protein